jgi:hypothetical protein
MQYQQSVRKWVEHCFGVEVANDIPTRCFRFFEEAGELCQSLGMTKAAALKLVEYTWGRPVGEPQQELGGVMVTLAALAEPAKLDMNLDGWIELSRCWAATDKIRAKQKSKKALGLDVDDPLPGGAGIETHTNKYVTQLMAIQVAQHGEIGIWLPQGMVWRIVGETGTCWVVEEADSAVVSGRYQLPKTQCSDPRGAP